MHGKHGRGKYAVVDDADYSRVNAWRWTVTDQGYARASNGTDGYVLMHRLVAGPPDHLEVDHANGDRLDNRRANLRACTRQKNALNRAISSNNTSGFRGVCLVRSTGKWVARIAKGGRRRHLGEFDTPEEASAAYEAAAAETYGDFDRASASDALGREVRSLSALTPDEDARVRAALASGAGSGAQAA